MSFQFDNSYARDLPGFYVPWQPVAVRAPQLVFLNQPLLTALGINLGAEAEVAAMLSGNQVPEGAEPLAQVYAGHQFGGFAEQLGDGRALLLGEHRHAGQRYDIALKGSGRTPFSRGGDGRAALGPMLREVLLSESMHALGVPTTRALAVVATGEPVYREQPLPGAVLTRVAASHLRVGTFEFFAARDETERVRALADYAIARHDLDLVGSSTLYLGLLQRVVRRQARLIAQWLAVGFVHGVMNTDNMTLSGETIDYGPCAFLEAYAPNAVFSSIDRYGRYAYAKQAHIAQWNLARFAETLLPLLADDIETAMTLARVEIAAFADLLRTDLEALWTAKLGLVAWDAGLLEDWLSLLQQRQVDFTLAWRYLGDAAAGDAAPLQALIDSPELSPWLVRWQGLRDPEVDLQQINPRIIARNQRVEEALAAATAGDLQPFEHLLAAVRRPFANDAALDFYAEPAPAAFTAQYKTFCGT